MDGDSLRIAILTGLAGLGALWFLSTLIFRVAGTWERVLTDEEREEGLRPERLTLGQLGPLVNGRRDVAGGYQEYFGYMVGRTLRIKRRDYGVQALMAQGFPEAIAKQLDGEIMARMTYRLTGGGAFLEGAFLPQKVEFTHRPPKITDAYFLAPQPRSYRRVIPLPAEESVEVWEKELTGEHPEATPT